MGDSINHPSHYNGEGYECIEVMKGVFGVDEVKTFYIMNAFKYIWRYENKNGLEDIKKAKWHIGKYIELSEEG